MDATAFAAADKVSIDAGAGNDTLRGGAGGDTFRFKAGNLTSADTVTGGTGSSVDSITFLDAGTLLAAAFNGVSHVERIVLATGVNSLAISNALVGSADDNHVLSVYGSNNASPGNDTINASAVTTAANSVHFFSGNGDDHLTGGAGADLFVFKTADLNGSDTVNGGTGTSVDALQITTSGNIAAAMLAGVSHIEKILFGAGNHQIALTDALAGSADDNHVLTVFGNSGTDVIDGSGVTTAANSVRFAGLGGGDLLIASAGNDRFIYTAVGDSNSDANGTRFDTIQNFDAAHDRIDLPGLPGITAVNSVASGNLSCGTGTFDSDLQAAVNSALGAHTAVLFHTTGGNFPNHDMLIVNPTGTAGYAAGADYVFDITGYSGTIAPSNFI